MMLGVEGVPQDQLQIRGLDIKDAFLMASQEEPVQITTKAGRFKVMKNLPSQRLAAKAWYDFLASFFEKGPKRTLVFVEGMEASSFCCMLTT